MPGQQSFPRTERLTHRQDFLRIYREGQKWVGNAFICYGVRRAGQGREMGCAVSRKVGRAVVRNRVKRYIREVYRKHRATLRDDVHLVVVARPASAGLDYHACEREIRRFFREGDVVGG